MKAFYILAPLVAALAGCSYYNTPPVAVAPVVSPTPNTVVLGAPGSTTTPSTVIVQPAR